MIENDFASNGNDGMVMIQNTRWSIGSEWRLGYHAKHGYETETHVGRYIGKMQWLMPFIGFDGRYGKMRMDEQTKTIFGLKNTKDNRMLFSIGVNYTLPMLVVIQGEMYQDGNFRVQCRREDIPVSKRIRMGVMINTDKEYMAELRYILGKNVGVRMHYDSDMGLGFGVRINY